MLQKPAFERFLYLLVALVCLVARQYLLPQTGLTDYDSVRNWQIVQEIGAGDFTHLFHHASPGFFLLFAPLALFSPGVLPFICLNQLFNVATVLLVIRFGRRHLHMSLSLAFLSGLLFGLSVFAVTTARNFATESSSMFLFMLAFTCYHRRLQHGDKKALLQAAGWLALGLTINYKLLLVLPVAAVLEFWQRDHLLTRRVLAQALGILALPFLLFALVAVLADQPFYRFPAAIISINHFTRPTPAQRTGRFNLDLLYYFYYLRDFEWLLVLPGILFFPIVFRDAIFRRRGQRLNTLQFLFLVVYLILLGMHLLVKAPRGLMLIYGLLYLLTGLVLHRALHRRWLLLAVLVSGLVSQTYKLFRHVYAYTPSHYEAVADYLAQHHIRQVASTAGINLVPYARSRGIRVQVVNQEEDLQALKKQGFTHVLLDNYYKAANIRQFQTLEKLPPVQSWPEPPLQSPFLYLDHAEFNGLSYRQVMTNHAQARQDRVQLRLLRIP